MGLCIFDLILHPFENQQSGVALVDHKFLPPSLEISKALFICADEATQNALEILSGVLPLAQLKRLRRVVVDCCIERLYEGLVVA